MVNNNRPKPRVFDTLVGLDHTGHLHLNAARRYTRSAIRLTAGK